MIRLLKLGDVRPFVCLSVIPAEAALAGSHPVAWLDGVRPFRPAFGQAWGEPASPR